MQHIKHLVKDKKIHQIIDKKTPVVLDKKNNVYLILCFSIISQQLSTKVADVIQKRFLRLFSSKTPSLEKIIATPFESLRSIGLSNAKANYVLNVCHFFMENKLTDKKLHALEDEELIELLTRIKGVGRWTSEMILMFALGREDVFAADDLGIQQAMIKLYALDPADKKALKLDMIRISEKWKPYRTYACRYLWAWKDEPVIAKKK
jgi:DNA-3-methyladenine glycosylase II